VADSIRAAVMTVGHCSFCGGPAERSVISGAWWHLDQSCGHGPNGGAVAVPAGAIPKGPLGWNAQWPARFVPGAPPELDREESADGQ
jgi:hypothetical protein